MNRAMRSWAIAGKTNLMLLPSLRKITSFSLPSSSKHTISISQNLQGSSPALSLSSNTCYRRSYSTTMNDGIEEIFAQKRSLRTKIRQQLRNMSPAQRAQEDNTIQNIVLEAPWFKSANSLCAYVSCDALREVDTSKILSEVLSPTAQDNCARNKKRLYLPRIEDRNSNMRMIRISSSDELVPNSMDILEPSVQDLGGNQREDLMQANEPVDLFILPGLAFDKSGRRLGRSGGYYDMFLKKYLEVAKEREWKPPLLVALSYSIQIVDEGAIAITSDDVPVDVLVCPSGLISTNVDGRKLAVTEAQVEFTLLCMKIYSL